MSAPSVYAAIHAIAADFAIPGIAKNRINRAEDYKYRSIDDLLGGLSPLLAKHRLCILPQVFERVENRRYIEGEGPCLHVLLRIGFRLTSIDDGTSHLVEAYGEALDRRDKATAKAMSGAYKSAMVQTFCISVGSAEDADHCGDKLERRSHQPEPGRGRHRLYGEADYRANKLGSASHEPEPVQGWQRWSDDIIDIIAVCESVSAISVVQDRHRASLLSISRERPELYARIGKSFTSRREALRLQRSAAGITSSARKARSNSKANDRSDQGVQHA